MSRAEALALADELAQRGESIVAYCRRVGLEPSTVTTRAYRAGVRLGVAVRRRRVELTEERRRQAAPGQKTRASYDCGWSSHTAFLRARRAVLKWDEMPAHA